MPVTVVPQDDYKQAKYYQAKWEDWKGGLNSLLRDTEINSAEMAKAENLMLVGSGVPTKRWGSANYFLAGEAGRVRAVGGYYKSDGTNELLAITDSGYLTKKSGASYAIITGASWSSGYNAEMTQLNNNMYIVDGNKVLTKYNGSNLLQFTQLTQPTGLSATNLSGVSGTFTYSWRVSAESEVGETRACPEVSLSNLPQNIETTTIRLTWTGSSPASYVKGYVIYGRDPGNTKFMNRTNNLTTTYLDDGTDVPATLAEPPVADTTGGPIASFITRYDNRIVVARLSTAKNRVMFSGKAGSSEKFHWAQGGGYIDIDTDSGDDITGLGVFQNKLIVFKEKSIWEITFSEVQLGNYTVTWPTATAITKSHGCVSGKTICSVENDLFFLSRQGVYILGYEPNITNVLRTNELSVRIRPEFEGISYADLTNASAAYSDKKYILSFLSNKKSYIYDRERMCWMGPWATSYGITRWHTYYDSTGVERYLAGTDDHYVVAFDKNYKNDRGVAFSTYFKSKKEDFGDWSSFKKIVDAVVNLQNLSGTISVKFIVESRNGSTDVAKSFVITTSSSNSGWGADQWGDYQWGDSEGAGSASDITDIIKRILLHKSARNIQIEIRTSASSDNYELLGIRLNAKGQGRGNTPYSWIV